MCYESPSLADIPPKKGVVYGGEGFIVLYRSVSDPFFGGYSAKVGNALRGCAGKCRSAAGVKIDVCEVSTIFACNYMP